MLPDKIFFTGVPGSRWSGISQRLETISGINTTDRKPDRSRTFDSDKELGAHIGNYFGPEMEFPVSLDNLDAPYSDPSAGCKILKCHEWAYHLDEIKKRFPKDWIMMVYRPDHQSLAWWFQVGGFDIKYPCYDAYKNSANMMAEIIKQNDAILKFGYKHNCQWDYFSPDWTERYFGSRYQEYGDSFDDVLVTLI